MQVESKMRHSFRAWIYPMDLIQYLHIEGAISTNGEKPIVILKRDDPQPFIPNKLKLKFDIDVYDPEGSARLDITTYEEIAEHLFESVVIKASKGDINLIVEHREREDKND